MNNNNDNFQGNTMGTNNQQPLPNNQPVNNVNVNNQSMNNVNNQPVMNNGQVVNNQQAVNNQPVVNTAAVKAKTNELMGKAKTLFATYKEKLKTDKKVLYGSIGVGAVVVILLVFLIANTMFNPAKSVVRKYANAMVDMDAKEIVELFHEDYLDNGYFDEDDLEDLLDSGFEELKDDDFAYKKFKIDNDYKKYDKDDLEELAEELEETYDIDEDDVQEARRYTIEFIVDDDGDKDEEKTKIVIVKIKGKWYLTLEQ